jgi:threonine dehydrogenase-like Zn-dependent dehydrogenase
LDLVQFERTLLGSFAHVMEPDFVEAVDLMASGAIHVGGYISAIVPLAEVVERVFEPLAAGSATGVKYLIDPNEPRL